MSCNKLDFSTDFTSCSLIITVECLTSEAFIRKDKPCFPSSFLSSSLHLLSFALIYLPLLLPHFPFLPLLAQLPKTHSVLVGSVLPWKTSDSCCLCVFVRVMSLRRGLAPYVGPHLQAGEDYEQQGLIKTGFVYPPACNAATTKTVRESQAAPRKATVNTPREGTQK